MSERSRRGSGAWIPAALSIFLLVAVQSAAGKPQSVRDDLGRPFPLPETTPARIVSMAPNITEILFALGLGRNVVGVTRFCDYPPEAVSIAKIGGLVDPNIERIQALAPDLVIAFRGNPLRIVNRLTALKLPVFVLDIGTGLDALYPLIARIGLVTRREREARGLAAGLRAKQDAVETALSTI
ncbi:MAG: helical backbone metal receptor, partial [Candidatus Aminicenantales bacterium]